MPLDGRKVQKLTIDEVAKRLGMSEDAVRKLSLDEDADPPVGGSGSAGRRQQRFWDIAQIPTYIAASGLLIYILGLLTLGFDINRAYTHDFATTRYAVSVMPQTAVAGSGVLLLLGLPLLGSAITVGSIFLLLRMFRAARRRGPGRTRLVTRTARFIALLVLVISIVGVVVSGYVAGGFFLALVYGTAYMAFLGLIRYIVRRPSILGLATGEPHYLRMLAVFFLFNFLWALLVVVTQSNEPALPTVEISGGAAPEGTLLTHADGFWYVFDCGGECKGGHRATLVAVPDSEVKNVQVSRTGD
jgi:hypothetical protein